MLSDAEKNRHLRRCAELKAARDSLYAQTQTISAILSAQLQAAVDAGVRISELERATGIQRDRLYLRMARHRKNRPVPLEEQEACPDCGYVKGGPEVIPCPGEHERLTLLEQKYGPVK